jgi:pimeloyl-ACP methyl ester carboxylesterase
MPATDGPAADSPSPVARRHPRRALRWLRRAFVAGFVLWLILGAAASWKLTRRPRPPFAEPPPTVNGVVMEQLRLHTSDGEDIGAWYLPGRRDRGTVVFLHGIGGSRSMFANLFAPLSRDGYGVLALSLRSHGDSTGGPHDAGYSARHDVVAAVDFLERDHAGGRIVLCGSSFGGAAAAFASDELGPRVHGYVFDSLYPDLPSALWNRVNRYLPPGLDYAAYGAFRLWAPVFLPTNVELLRPADHVARIREDIPVVLAVGSEDFRATPAESRRMFESASSHANYEEFPGAGHSLLNVNDPERYVRLLGSMLNDPAVHFQTGATSNGREPAH